MTNVKIILKSLEEVKHFVNEQKIKFPTSFPLKEPDTLNLEKQLENLNFEKNDICKVFFLVVNEVTALHNSIEIEIVAAKISKKDNELFLFENLEIMMRDT